MIAAIIAWFFQPQPAIVIEVQAFRGQIVSEKSEPSEPAELSPYSVSVYTWEPSTGDPEGYRVWVNGVEAGTTTEPRFELETRVDSDLDGDGAIGVQDFVHILKNFGRGTDEGLHLGR